MTRWTLVALLPALFVMGCTRAQGDGTTDAPAQASGTPQPVQPPPGSWSGIPSGGEPVDPTSQYFLDVECVRVPADPARAQALGLPLSGSGTLATVVPADEAHAQRGRWATESAVRVVLAPKLVVNGGQDGSLWVGEMIDGSALATGEGAKPWQADGAPVAGFLGSFVRVRVTPGSDDTTRVEFNGVWKLDDPVARASDGSRASRHAAVAKLPFARADTVVEVPANASALIVSPVPVPSSEGAYRIATLLKVRSMSPKAAAPILVEPAPAIEGPVIDGPMDLAR